MQRKKVNMFVDVEAEVGDDDEGDEDEDERIDSARP